MLILTMFLTSAFLAGSPTAGAEGDARSTHAYVEQFGPGFNEIVIATDGDDLNVPRDLEFHPSSSRQNELWVVNRATDSITIIHNAGLANQSSENRQDAYGNHFMEEVSAIAFGQDHSEFDYIFASAQETRNTYNGQQPPNNFMGPALWPSSLSHFAVENQQPGGPLGSHLDMLHESPNGVGIAHDSGNAYWYNDGYYGELVYYDFHDDHDTGGEDHEDGVVRRYTEITPTRSAGVPGHMVLDKANGILYIADTGAGRILWVNTDDPTTTTTDIMGSSTQKDSVLAEYSEITDVEWGVLTSSLSSPSGIALHGDTLFVSQNGNGKIGAYELANDGKSATHMQTVDTNANSIMGLEVGPGDKLWYVDAGLNRVIRIDPFPDADRDGIRDSLDDCPMTHGTSTEDRLGCPDTDDDGWSDDGDSFVFDITQWADGDSDGYGDNPAPASAPDDCPGVWGNSTLDSLGCLDSDGDGWSEASDSYPNDKLLWSDDDGDGYADQSGTALSDDCPEVAGTSIWSLLGCIDTDGDGWADTEDEYPLDVSQWRDTDEDGYGDNADGTDGDLCPLQEGYSAIDRLGCPDADEDGYSDPADAWTVDEGADAFPSDDSQWRDSDLDGFGDNPAPAKMADVCPVIHGTSTEDRLGCPDTDDDGWSDDGDSFVFDITQWADGDSDGYGDNPAPASAPDGCPAVWGNSTLGSLGCLDSDGDGWSGASDPYPNDKLLWSDDDGDGYADQSGTALSDDCPEVAGTSTEDRLGCIDTDGDGWSDEADYYPADAERHVKSILPMILLVAAIVAVIATLLILRRRSGGTASHTLGQHSIAPPPEPAPVQQAPPRPADGLPPGWTEEQWEYYGQEWLDDNE
jgi:hypothetical protein